MSSIDNIIQFTGKLRDDLLEEEAFMHIGEFEESVIIGFSGDGDFSICSDVPDVEKVVEMLGVAYNRMRQATDGAA